jgi:uncharacterized protein (TIGR00299 family) protein
MLLAALVDAGAPLDPVTTAVNAVIPGSVVLASSQVSRSGLRSTKVDVKRVLADQTHRSWREIQTLLEQADLAVKVRERSQRVFRRLAEAEARVHGITTDDVRFHEVGAWDSIADVVGVCTALDCLGVTSMSCSAVALGSGRVTVGHGELPVPVPAVLELSPGWQVMFGGEGELATPTGMALVTTLARECRGLPAMTVHTVGVGAGTRDTAGHPNVVRVVLGDRHGAADSSDSSVLSVLETNIDDMDPRVWPTVLASLFAAGAADAWLVPIIMKKGRPAQTLTVLASPANRDALRRLIFELTTTSGVRETTVSRIALDRFWVPVSVAGGQVHVKVAHHGGEIVQATPEFDEAAAVATTHNIPVRRVLQEAIAAAERAGLVAGRPVPESQ